MLRRKASAVAVAVFVFCGYVAFGAFLSQSAGCAHKNVRIDTATLPMGVSEAEVKLWFTATGTLENIAQMSHDIQEAVIRVNKIPGAFPDGPAYVATLRALGKIKVAQLEAVKGLREVPNQFGKPTAAKVEGYANIIFDAFEELISTGLVGVKNADSRTALNSLLDQLRLAISTLRLIITEAKA